VPRFLSHAFLIVAVLVATGSHWLVLQSIAWTGMLASNLQENSFTSAIERTFGGEHPCCLCKQISKGKQTEKKSDLQLTWKKLEFPLSMHVLNFIPQSRCTEMPCIDFFAKQLTYTPPVPPPRLISS
jgi:hypothetical protein